VIRGCSSSNCLSNPVHSYPVELFFSANFCSSLLDGTGCTRFFYLVRSLAGRNPCDGGLADFSEIIGHAGVAWLARFQPFATSVADPAFDVSFKQDSAFFPSFVLLRPSFFLVVKVRDPFFFLLFSCLVFLSVFGLFVLKFFYSFARYGSRGYACPWFLRFFMWFNLPFSNTPPVP